MEEREVKLGALLLSALMLAADDELAKLRKQRIGRDSAVDLAHLLRVREILTELHAAIVADDAQRWRRVHDAWKVLHDTRSDDTRLVTDQGVVQGAAPQTTAASPSDHADQTSVEPTRLMAAVQAAREPEQRPNTAGADDGGLEKPPLMDKPAVPLPDFSQRVPERPADRLQLAQHEVSPWAEDVERSHDGPDGDEPAAAPAHRPLVAPPGPAAGPDKPQPASPQAPPAPSPVGEPAAPVQPSRTIGLPGGVVPKAPGATLPFAGDKPTPAPVIVEGSRRPTGTLDAPAPRPDPSTLPFVSSDPDARARAELEHAPTLDATNEMPGRQADGSSSATRADPTARLGVAGYAALRAVAKVVPEAAVITRTVYGVAGERGLAELEQQWQARFETTPELREVYDALHGQFCVWLQRHARG